MRASVFKFRIHLESGQVYCGTENQDAEIYFTIFFYFSISHSSVIHREICVKDFTGITAPRILKFGTNVGYDLLYCVKETQHAAAYHYLFFVHFSFSPVKLFITEFSAPITARVFKFCVHLERDQVYCGKENQDSVINICLFLPFFLFFSISHSNVIHREICVKYFSGTAVPRILKFFTNVGYDLLYCLKENQHAAVYHYPYLSIFLSLQANFLLHISQLLWEPDSSNFVNTLRVAKYIMGQKTKLIFSISHSNVIHREMCDEYFTGTIACRIL